MLSNVRRKRLMAGGIGLIAILIICVLLIVKSETRLPDAAPSFAGPGTLILIASPAGGPPSIYELTPGDAEPSLMWDGLPDTMFHGSSIVSQNGEYVLFESDPLCFVLNLRTGAYAQIPAESGISLVAFSPDNRYLAYVAATEPHELNLLDLETNEIEATLYVTPCKSYMGAVGYVCGTISQPFWLDEDTILFSAFVGELPKYLTPDPFGVGYLELTENQTFVTRIDDGVRVEFATTIVRIAEGIQSGPTLVTQLPGFPYAAWFETSDILIGRYDPHYFPAADNYWDASSLSPDGEYALIGSALIELRTGRTRVLRYPLRNDRYDLTWSPDMESIAYSDEYPAGLLILPFERQEEPTRIPIGNWGSIASILSWLP